MFVGVYVFCSFVFLEIEKIPAGPDMIETWPWNLFAGHNPPSLFMNIISFSCIESSNPSVNPLIYACSLSFHAYLDTTMGGVPLRTVLKTHSLWLCDLEEQLSLFYLRKTTKIHEWTQDLCTVSPSDVHDQERHTNVAEQSLPMSLRHQVQPRNRQGGVFFCFFSSKYSLILQKNKKCTLREATIDRKSSDPSSGITWSTSTDSPLPWEVTVFPPVTFKAFEWMRTRSGTSITWRLSYNNSENMRGVKGGDHSYLLQKSKHIHAWFLTSKVKDIRPSLISNPQQILKALRCHQCNPVCIRIHSTTTKKVCCGKHTHTHTSLEEGVALMPPCSNCVLKEHSWRL